MVRLPLVSRVSSVMDIDADMQQWEQSVPDAIRSDVLWKSTAYRLATYLADIAWVDITALAADPRTVSMADQLARAVNSIGAHYSEGYGRGTDRDRCRVYEYALGEAREARNWAYKARHVIGPERANQLISITTRIVQLLTVTVVRERKRDSRFGEFGPRRRAT